MERHLAVIYFAPEVVTRRFLARLHSRDGKIYRAGWGDPNVHSTKRTQSHRHTTSNSAPDERVDCPRSY